MFFVVQSNDSFNFPLGWIKYIVTVFVTPVRWECRTLFGTSSWPDDTTFYGDGMRDRCWKKSVSSVSTFYLCVALFLSWHTASISLELLLSWALFSLLFLLFKYGLLYTADVLHNTTNNNNNRELIERFQKLKALYNWTSSFFKAKQKIIQCANIQAYRTHEN